MGGRSLADTAAVIIAATLIMIATGVGIYAVTSGKLDQPDHSRSDLREAQRSG